jgi:polyribonucleotide nucleotidyltransferase
LLKLQIDPEKIGMLIGPGGKMIRAIQEETGVTIDVDDDGVVLVAATDGEWAKKAQMKIEAVTATVQVGKIYDGRVSSVKDFGAFVEILPGRDGLCHISEFSDDYISNVADVVNVGDEMKVKVIAIDEQDRVKLSHRQAMAELGLEPQFVGQSRESGDGDDRGERRERSDRGDRGDRRGGGRGRGGRGRDRDRD